MSLALSNPSDRRYYQIARIRRVEQKIAQIYNSDCIKSPVHLSIGQEAIPVAVCEHLTQRDVCFGTYRSHALYLAKGGCLNGMMAELFGKIDGCGSGKAGSMHLIDLNAGVMGTSAVVGTTAPNALGYAYAQKLKNSGVVTTCFIGDGATEEGSFYEAMNFAALKQLPILFICENNGYAIHSKLSSRQANTSIFEKVRAFGVESSYIANQDFDSLSGASLAAIKSIRSGLGPRFIECKTYRDIQHVGPNPDYDLGYRDESEAKAWRTSDPLLQLGKQVKAEQKEAIDQKIEQELEAAIKFAELSPFPKPSELMKDIYAE